VILLRLHERCVKYDNIDNNHNHNYNHNNNDSTTSTSITNYCSIDDSVTDEDDADESSIVVYIIKVVCQRQFNSN